MKRRDIKSFSLENLEKDIKEIRVPKYRAKQIFSWLYTKGVKDFDEMTDLGAELREILKKNYYIPQFVLEQKQVSKYDVIKFLFKLFDDEYIETVLIKGKGRNTLCISTQVGCRFGCVFCSSGEDGFIRNLKISEILDQIIYVKNTAGYKIDNYVFMGMGEPLDNYDNTLGAISIMNDPNGFKIAARRITVSTNGFVPGIERVKHFPIQINLSVSLHAAVQEKRKAVMPVASKYSLSKLMRALKHYQEVTGRMPTLEYTLIKGFNDSPLDALGLVQIAREIKAKVNLIPYSYTGKKPFVPSTPKVVSMFVNKLMSRRIRVTFRESKGKDIKAACGQLAGRYKR